MTVTYDTIFTTQVASGTTTVINATNIPQTFRHLRCVLSYAHNTNAANISYRINGNSNASYTSYGLRANNSNQSVHYWLDNTSCVIGIASYTGTNPRSYLEFYIYNYTSTGLKNGTFMSVSQGDTNANSNIIRGGTTIPIAQAVTSINILCESGDFNAGTTFTVYGLA